jgi:hypothetical protein
VLIANTITRALVQSGHKRPARSSGNTILAHVIQTVLIRMGYKEIETGAIAQHLLRWYAWAGDPNSSD